MSTSDNLLEALRAMPRGPRGGHLTDEQCRDYLAGGLSGADLRAADQHLASCRECSERLAADLEAKEASQPRQQPRTRRRRHALSVVVLIGFGLLGGVAGGVAVKKYDDSKQPG